MGFLSSLFGKKNNGRDNNVFSNGAYDNGTYRYDAYQAAGNKAGAGKGGWHEKVDAFDPDDRDCRKNMITVRARVERVMNEEWCSRDSTYEIRREIRLHDMGWPELEAEKEPRNYGVYNERLYGYGLYRMGQPVAVVLFLPNNSCYNRRDVKAFHRACENRGIFCMNLMPKFPNCYAYIRERLTENVRL